MISKLILSLLLTTVALTCSAAEPNTSTFRKFLSVEKNCISLVGVHGAAVESTDNLDTHTAQLLAAVLRDATAYRTNEQALNGLRIACMQKLIAAGYAI
jgi:hypothetical protein